MSPRAIVLRLLCAIAVGLGALAAAAQHHPNLAKGFHADKVYQFNDIDHVNLFNGNLNVVVPVGNAYSAGGSLNYTFTLSYSGNNWQYWYDEEWVDDNPVTHELVRKTKNWSIPYPNSNGGLGWNLSLGRIIKRTTLTDTCNCIVYQSPDGAEHQFYQQLHNEPPAVAGVSYTNDGSYLRMKTEQIPNTSPQQYRYFVEFPDGHIKEFDDDGDLVRISDRFTNEIAVDYSGAGVPDPVGGTASTCARNGSLEGLRKWRVHDSAGREHYLYLQQRPALEPAVCQANLAAFPSASNPAGRAIYTFAYVERVISRQGVATDLPADTSIGPTVMVPLMTKIGLPDGSAFEFVYDIGARVENDVIAGLTTDDPRDANRLSYIAEARNPGSFTGHLVSAKLPTGAKIDWKYRSYSFPNADVPAFDDDPPYTSHVPGLGTSAGVLQRIVTLDGTSATWNYASDLLVDGSGHRPAARTTLTDPLSNVTESYFSACRSCSPASYPNEEYGLPFARLTPVAGISFQEPNDLGNGHFLSTVVRRPDGKVLQRRYVKYERDPQGGANQYDMNSRVAGETVIRYRDNDTEADRATTAYSDFDGLGHYRRKETGGTFAGQNVRVEVVNYNRPDPQVDSAAFDSGVYPGSFQRPALTSPWILDMFSSKVTTEGSSTLKSLHWFDNGLLRRQRVLANATALGARDLVSVFDYERGEVIREEFYGGDDPPGTTTAGIGSTALKTLSLSDVKYVLNHSHAHDANRVTRTWYSGMTFNVGDYTVDRNTGFAATSRDVSGLATTFDYDAMGRLRTIAPPGSAPTTYTYTAAAALAKATAEATTTSTTSGTVRSKYEYDGLGRLTTEWKLLPNGKWSVQRTDYSISGLRLAQTVPEEVDDSSGRPSANVKKTTYSDFDPFGRPSVITGPDGSQTTFAYDGASKTSRTVGVGNPAVLGTTTEVYDRQARLMAVIEPNGVQTTYGYDAGGRLTRVCANGDGIHCGQARAFTYDGRGFLTSEEHPEQARVTYTYDARGHALSKRYPDRTASDLNYVYDPAERLTLVIARDMTVPPGMGFQEFRNLKKFDYGASGSLGRLTAATRWNRIQEFSGIKVIESYAYDPASGRVDTKTTELIHLQDGSVLQKLTQSAIQDDLGLLRQVSYPKCLLTTIACGQSTMTANTISYSRTNGALTTVPGYVNQVTYGPSGIVKSVVRNNGVTDTTTPDDSGLPRPKSISFSSVTACVGPSITTQPSSKRVAAGGTTTLTVVAGGTGPLHYQWFIRRYPQPAPAQGTGAQSASFTAGEGDYFVQISNACGVIRSQMVIVAVGVPPPAPAWLEAKASASMTSIDLQWGSVADAARYFIERKDSGGAFVRLAGSVTTTTTTDTVLADKTYVYRVIAEDGSNIASLPSPVDAATTVSIPVVTPGSPVGAAHFDLLLHGVNRMRAAAGAGPLSWGSIVGATVPPPSGGGIIHGAHVAALRSTLNAARAAIELSELSFADPFVGSAGGIAIRAAHVNDIRGGLQ